MLAVCGSTNQVRSSTLAAFSRSASGTIARNASEISAIRENGREIRTGGSGRDRRDIPAFVQSHRESEGLPQTKMIPSDTATRTKVISRQDGRRRVAIERGPTGGFRFVEEELDPDQALWRPVYKGGFFDVRNVSIPVAVSAFPDEIYQAPRSWAEKAYPKLIYYNRLPKGGHFAAWEQPELFTEELRAAFRSLR